MKIVSFARATLVFFMVTSLFFLSACQNKKAPTTSSIGAPIKGLKTVYFDFDEYNIRDDQAAVLQANGDYLKTSSSVQVVIEGHCDERGTNEYNLALGDRRAGSSKDYLTNLGVSPNRMRTISYGEERPVATCHDESCWWQNRRADFVK